LRHFLANLDLQSLVFSSRCLPIFHDCLSQIGQNSANLPRTIRRMGHAQHKFVTKHSKQLIYIWM
jgi:hypothetical protein